MNDNLFDLMRYISLLDLQLTSAKQFFFLAAAIKRNATRFLPTSLRNNFSNKAVNRSVAMCLPFAHSFGRSSALSRWFVLFGALLLTVIL